MLTAGRELDALVAEKVMGITPKDVRVRGEVDTPLVRVCNESAYWREDGRHDRYQLRTHADAQCYSADIELAWQVVEKMLALGWYFDLRNYGTWTAIFDRDSGSPDDHATDDGDSAPLAICRAALAAVGAA
jgi:hypothetical protein